MHENSGGASAQGSLIGRLAAVMAAIGTAWILVIMAVVCADVIGRAGFNRAMAIVAGGSPEKETALPSPIITKENAVKFYDENSKF